MSGKATFWNPPFPEKLLFDEEVVVIDLKPHWWYFAKVFSALAVAAAAMIWASRWDESNPVETWGGVLITAILVSCALWLIIRWTKWRSTHLVVTSDRVIFRSGVLLKRGTAIPLERVDNVDVEQTILGRLIKSGDLRVESAGPEGWQAFSDIRRPDDVQKIIHSQIEENDRRSRGHSGGPVDVATQLERLEGLRDRGSLTPEEFQREKHRLLGDD